MHGSYSWLATFMANVLSAGQNAPIAHWWVILESDKAYYSINIWVNDVINVYRSTDWRSVNQVGLANVQKAPDSTIWTEKSIECNRSLK